MVALVAVLLAAAPPVQDPNLTASGQQRFEVSRRLGDAGIVFGLVTDDDDRPIAGATVWAGAAETETGADGTFSLHVAGEAFEHLGAGKKGYLCPSTDLRFDTRSPRYLRVRLAVPVVLAGTVAHARSGTVGVMAHPGTQPSLWPLRWWPDEPSTVPIVDGGFRITGLLPGSYVLHYPEGHLAVRAPDERVRVSGPSGRIEGRIDDFRSLYPIRVKPPADDWPAGRSVSWEEGQRGEVSPPGRPDGGSGGYAVDSLLPGCYVIELESRCLRRTVCVDGGTVRVDLPLPPPGWSVSGRVTEPNGGRPKQVFFVDGYTVTTRASPAASARTRTATAASRSTASTRRPSPCPSTSASCDPARRRVPRSSTSRSVVTQASSRWRWRRFCPRAPSRARWSTASASRFPASRCCRRMAAPSRARAASSTCASRSPRGRGRCG